MWIKMGHFESVNKLLMSFCFKSALKFFLTLQVTYLMVLVPDNDCQPRPDTVSVVENI